jgi:hypothetical protein
VGVSLVLLLFCRLANVMVPLTFKHAIDLLTEVNPPQPYCRQPLTYADVC